MRMRRDFEAVAADRRRNQDWVEQDALDLEAEIRASINSGNEEDIDAWSDYLAHESAEARHLERLCREAEERIRSQRQAMREALEGNWRDPAHQ